MDGALTRINILHEGFLDICRRSPRAAMCIPFWLVRGMPDLGDRIGAASKHDAGVLPLREDLLSWLKEQKSGGRKLILVSTSGQTITEQLASRVGIFDEVVVVPTPRDASGESMRQTLVAKFGEQGFDYIGSEKRDLAVWRSARRAIVVGSAALSRQARAVADVERLFHETPAPLAVWIKAIRVHQWIKNVLVFIPAFAAHRILEPSVLITTVCAFLAFNLCASSVYIINDLLDLSADRRHPRKARRPFASGALSAKGGLILAIALLFAAACIAIATNPWFGLVLVAYYGVTWAYSLRLKRAALIDVITLATLYTLRIVAGSAATMIIPSFWLLAFSMFIFLCLGIVKRYTELHDVRETGRFSAGGRGYTSHDMELLLTMGMASGFTAIVVVALYINSPESQQLYRWHEPMWLICPLLLYWVMRMWLLATRGQMNDDPVVFTLRDPISLTTFGLVGLLVFAAM
jgi:4-hydroxybenzoate polyprenyltransferase